MLQGAGFVRFQKFGGEVHTHRNPLLSLEPCIFMSVRAMLRAVFQAGENQSSARTPCDLGTKGELFHISQIRKKLLRFGQAHARASGCGAPSLSKHSAFQLGAADQALVCSLN